MNPVEREAIEEENAAKKAEEKESLEKARIEKEKGLARKNRLSRMETRKSRWLANKICNDIIDEVVDGMETAAMIPWSTDLVENDILQEVNKVLVAVNSMVGLDMKLEM